MTLPFLFAVALVDAPPVKLDVRSGTVRGTATVLTRMLDDGGKYVRLEMQVGNLDGAQVLVTQESSYRRDGKPITKSQTTLAGTVNRVVRVEFTENGAEVTVRRDDKSTTARIPYPVGAPYLATPEFWVFRDHPNPGSSTTYLRFDLDQQKWVTTTCKYVGVRRINIGKKKYSAHEMQMGDVMTFTDDHGDPLRLQTNGTVMERSS